MTTYRLPDGTEREAADLYSVPAIGITLVGFSIDGTTQWFPESLLTEIKPPIPAEPEPGAYLIGDALWFRPADARGARWVGPDGICWEWEQAWRRSLTRPDVTITPLVPSVPVEPVQLPQIVKGERGDYVSVNIRANGDIAVTAAWAGSSAVDVALKPEAAAKAGRALLSAADRSDQ